MGNVKNYTILAAYLLVTIFLLYSMLAISEKAKAAVSLTVAEFAIYQACTAEEIAEATGGIAVYTNEEEAKCYGKGLR